MFATKEMDLLSSLMPEEQVVVISLARSMVKSRNKKTTARQQFETECKKYTDRNMTMEEIDKIIHEED
ncbi:MAG: hypothetical protein PHE02_03735 [Lachnospiraceae bacterium]|nr:hypothetical protein [Lachnospiraceae bacterium]